MRIRGGAQEREDAARVFGAGAEAPAATFEPDEELAQAEEAAAVEPSAPTKGPTAEQLTAIKVPGWGSRLVCCCSHVDPMRQPRPVTPSIAVLQ